MIPLALYIIMENTYTIIKIENLISDITIKYFMYGLMIILPVYYQFVRQKYKKSEEKDVDYHVMMETKKNTEMTKKQFNARFVQKDRISRTQSSSVWIYHDLLEDKDVAVKILIYNDYDNFMSNTKEIEFLNKLKKQENIV